MKVISDERCHDNATTRRPFCLFRGFMCLCGWALGLAKCLRRVVQLGSLVDEFNKRQIETPFIDTLLKRDFGIKDSTTQLQIHSIKESLRLKTNIPLLHTHSDPAVRNQRLRTYSVLPCRPYIHFRDVSADEKMHRGW